MPSTTTDNRVEAGTHKPPNRARGEEHAAQRSRLSSGTAGLLMLVTVGCRDRVPDEEVPETLVAVPQVSSSLPMTERAMRIAVTEAWMTLDLRPLASTLSDEKKRFVRNATARVSPEFTDCNGVSSLFGLANELQRGEVVDLEVHPTVRVGRIADVLQLLRLCTNVTRHRFIVQTPRGIGMLDVDQRWDSVCRASPEDRDCAFPYLTLSDYGVQIEVSAVAVPAEPGCTAGVRRARLLDETWLDDHEVPEWHAHTILVESESCPSVPASGGGEGFDVARVLEEVRRFGPGCPGAVLDVDVELPWSGVAEILAVLRADLAYEFVRFAVSTKNEEPACTNGLVGSEIPTG
jgi:hypothetical protein